MYSIKIESKYEYNLAVLFGLHIEAPKNEFPLVVGCSVRAPNGGIIDIRHRFITSPGLALWHVKAPKECRIKSKWGSSPFDDTAEGEIIFALWSDDTHTKRLADTGWQRWDAMCLIGSSFSGLEMMEEGIRHKYKGRFEVWRDWDGNILSK